MTNSQHEFKVLDQTIESASQAETKRLSTDHSSFIKLHRTESHPNLVLDPRELYNSKVTLPSNSKLKANGFLKKAVSMISIKYLIAN